MNVLLSLLLLIFLYQVPVLRTPLKWLVGLIILGILVRYYKQISNDIKNAFK